MTKKQLWLNLKSYNFSHLVSPNLWQQLQIQFSGVNGPNLAFATKLSRKHGWKQKFSVLAIREYKKFIFLGIVSDFQVTPSEIIDIVWHEHLLFTKSYREFCTDIIQHPFDHHPELVPLADQTDTFHAQYQETLHLYKAEFGIDPPEIIWGKPKFDIRLVDRQLVRSVNLKKEVDVNPALHDSTPLIGLFNSELISVPAVEYPEFNGGDFGGGGAGSSWGGSDADATDGGGDSGSCSSCSSGCGGD
ncbi:hypothetical protein [Pollutibacter soli]|uniref:glycine-rich domain-containing protein n=1 Tax=Pollutibacter soli TaxID=3034157 RepID=UPI003013D07B